MLVNKKIFQFFVSNGEYFAEEIFEDGFTPKHCRAGTNCTITLCGTLPS